MLSPTTLLLIEDDRTLNKMYQDKFTQAGYEVTPAFSGFRCMELARNLKPSVILLDIVMPGKDGFDILKQLKKRKDTASIPVILLTNLSSDEDRRNGLNLGALDYLVKSSYTPHEVVEKIGALLERARLRLLRPETA